MKKNVFFRIDGGNGATFFFSTLDYCNWWKSLEFYRCVSRKVYVKKFLLKAAYPVFKQKAFLTAESVMWEMEKEFHITLSLSNAASAMISPTRDKVIIHRHGRGYEKIAIGKSRDGVLRELDVYRLLSRKLLKNFTVSGIGEAEENEQSVRFFMHYAEGWFSETMPSLLSLRDALVEFFLLPGIKKMRWQDLWNTLPDNLQYLIFAEDRIGETPVGLVHRDFKPWNVKSGKKPLFFDFESATFTGCPLEDFFNYTVDPMLHFSTPEQVWKKVQEERILAEELLNKFEISCEEFLRYWRWYLLERINFWNNLGQVEFGHSFFKLFEVSSK